MEKEHRICEVEGRRGVFFGFYEENKEILSISGFVKLTEVRRMKEIYDQDNAVLPGCDLKIISAPIALVEFEDGTIQKVDPERIRFFVGANKEETFNKAMQRLRKMGILDPFDQIAYLEDEIDYYREKIKALQRERRQ